MSRRYDLCVVGAGPAGCAAAIFAAAEGASVCLIDRTEAPIDRPGETLHPGAEVLFEQLGVREAVKAAAFLRFDGITVRRDQGRRHELFGQDQKGPWLGYQAPRRRLDAILRKRASDLGVTSLFGADCLSPLRSGDRIVGVETETGPIDARFLVDATGGRQWLARQLSLPVKTYSKSLIAHFGYAEVSLADVSDRPSIEIDSSGWTWSAQITRGSLAWLRLAFDGRPPAAGWIPPRWRHLRPLGRIGRANVTWRRCMQPAGAGYFLCGDANGVLDPSASRGVLKALASGIMAAHCALAACHSQRREEDVLRCFGQWSENWFLESLHGLKQSWVTQGV
ncbi:MAG: tryptophan 7-halogenase [Kiloniellales bacterium]